MKELLFSLAGLFYLAGTAGHLAFLWRQREAAAKVASWLMLGGLVCHTLSLMGDWAALGHIPAVTLRQALSLLAWTLVAGFLLLQLKYNLRVLGAFVSPLALLLIILAATQSGVEFRAVAGFGSAWLVLHVTASFFGDVFLALAAVAGLMYLLQERQIKSKHQGWFYTRLPSLKSLDSLGRACLVLGFALLTLGMLSGAVYGQFRTGAYWRWSPKEVWSLITWVLYAAILHQRLTVGWQGRKAAWLAIAGFGAVIFTFLGASFLLSDYHDFSTFSRAFRGTVR